MGPGSQLLWSWSVIVSCQCPGQSCRENLSFYTIFSLTDSFEVNAQWYYMSLPAPEFHLKVMLAWIHYIYSSSAENSVAWTSLHSGSIDLHFFFHPTSATVVYKILMGSSDCNFSGIALIEEFEQTRSEFLWNDASVISQSWQKGTLWKYFTEPSDMHSLHSDWPVHQARRSVKILVTREATDIWQMSDGCQKQVIWELTCLTILILFRELLKPYCQILVSWIPLCFF